MKTRPPGFAGGPVLFSAGTVSFVKILSKIGIRIVNSTKLKKFALI